MAAQLAVRVAPVAHASQRRIMLLAVLNQDEP